MELLDLAERVLITHQWATRRESALAEQQHLRFDLVAESETAIVFFEVVAGAALQRRADSLAASIAALTMQPEAGVKAWEAYLVLMVEDDYPRVDAAAQAVQRDLNYCRKVVIDGPRILRAHNPVSAMEFELSFLFPLALGAATDSENVRSQLAQLISAKGFDGTLVRSLVDSFDAEADCKCWERIESFVVERSGQ